MVECLIEEIWRRERVVRIFPTMDAAGRLIGARCAEQHEQWSTGYCYLTMDASFAREPAQAENATAEHAEAEPDPTATPLSHAA
jgi:transposase-like protein